MAECGPKRGEETMASRNSVHRTELALLLIGLACFANGRARCQTAPQTAPPKVAASDLTELSSEDLMNLAVPSGAKKEEPVQRTAAAIFVTTSEDIRRSGATNLPDVLRMAPGLDVAQVNGNVWA